MDLIDTMRLSANFYQKTDLNPCAPIFIPLDQISASESETIFGITPTDSDSSAPPVFDLSTPNCSLESTQSATLSNVHHVSSEVFSDNDSPCGILQSIRLKNLNRIIIAHLNINSIRNKIGLLGEMVSDRIDVLLVSETKLDNSFPTSQFRLNGYADPLRLDRTVHGGGLLLYIRNDITSTPLRLVSNHIECIIAEVKISNNKMTSMAR